MDQRCNESAFLDSWLNLDSDKVFGFNSNSIFKSAHCVSTWFTIHFSRQYFISIQFTIQFSFPTFHFISIHNSTPLKAGWGVVNKYHFPHPCWVCYGEILLDRDCYGTYANQSLQIINWIIITKKKVMQAHSYEQFQRKKEKHGWINFRGGEINLPLAGFFTTKSRAQFRFNSLRLHND